MASGAPSSRSRGWGEEPPRALVVQARRGDPVAFAQLVERTQDAVYALAYRLTYDAELARDIAQDVFLRLFEQLDRYDPQRPFLPWFRTVATRYTLNAREKARRRKALSLDAPLGGDPDGPRPDPADADAPAVPDRAADRERRQVVREAIRELPETYAGAVVLYYLEGLAVKEIAVRLDLPVGTVKIRLHRARALLRERLKRFDDSAGPG